MKGFNTYSAERNVYSKDEHSDRYTPPSIIVYPIEESPAVTQSMERDSDTLAEFLAPVEIPVYAPISEQIFGQQSRQSQISLEHTLNLITERSRIHKRHMDDIQQRHRELHGQLFGAQLHSDLDNHKREMNLQTTLLRLDAERRKEELAFWKDTSELRDKLFEEATEYQAVRHRTSLLGNAEPGGIPYGR